MSEMACGSGIENSSHTWDVPNAVDWFETSQMHVVADFVLSLNPTSPNGATTDSPVAALEAGIQRSVPDRYKPPQALGQ